MANIDIIGDALHFDGYFVGKISSKLPASVRGRLEEALENAYTDDCVEPISECDLEAIHEQVKKKVMKAAGEIAEANMIELDDLELVLQHLELEAKENG